LVQNHVFSEHLVQQNIIPLLIRYTEESPNDEVPLEIIYALLFTANGKKELRKGQYKNFVDHVKQLRQSGKVEVQRAAEGIIWKIEDEDIFKDNFDRQEAYPPPTSTYPPPMSAYPPPMSAYPLPMSTDFPPQSGSLYACVTSFPGSIVNNFHMMISYCWANKSLCHRICSRLQKDGYRIWIDEREMHGSIIERMAEGIERSDFILICMSSGYKKSSNCQAEAEYAFNRKKNIVPLIVEPKYKADGWLGFIVGSKIYVNFAETNEHEFETAYKNLVVELQRNGLPLLEQSNNLESSDIQLQEERNKSEPSLLNSLKMQYPALKSESVSNNRVSTTEYRNIEQINDWEAKNVVEFLVDQDLTILLTVLKGIDGRGLLELYRVYKHSPKALYKILSNNDPAISPGIFFKFIGVFKTFLNTSKQCAYF
ncbi:unnamed protein product, partial [Rotaria sp. Silwood1]